MTTTTITDRTTSGQTHSTSLLSALGAPFVATGRFLVMLAEANPRMRSLNRLSAISDAELEARGLDRNTMMRQILGVSAMI